ncbi:MAG: aminoglycoside phosphotransferase family protein [Deltaproteobacteria bacterium]|nr:aminoglycoside phosphotransferase family protein [Deltaproteobacteria bacterium]MCW5804340.1 aminoglycoside phosphotransferase family protein [Deltaproteobacteria bacterium]
MDARIFPLLDVSRADLEAAVGEPIVSAEPVGGGLTNTLHRVVLASGATVVAKHFPPGNEAGFADEVAILGWLAGTVPVPELVRADRERRVVVYRWVEGETLDDLRRRDPAAFAALAEPLGRLFAALARVEPLRDDDWDVDPLIFGARVKLLEGRARARTGAALADALAAAYPAWRDRLAWGEPCLVHGDIGGRNLLVHGGRIAGLIDWEAAATGSPLVDAGALFRYTGRYDDAFRAAFERGYRLAGGALPDDWYRASRLLDATRMIDILDEPRDLPSVFADCRVQLARLAADLVA